VPGTPATTTRLTIPRIASTDTDDVPRDINAAVDRIDVVAGRFESGLAAARPSTGAGIADRYFYATDTGELSRDAGGATPTWTVVNPRQVPTVTSLPGSPYDGQIIDYLVDATLGIVWRFRYRSASASSSKWEFLGGPPLISEHAGDSTALTNTAYAQTAPVVAVAPPVVGDYLFEHSCVLYNSAGPGLTSYQSIWLNGAGADADGFQGVPTTANYTLPGASGRLRRNVQAASVSGGVFLVGKVASGATGVYRFRKLACTPLRIG
jgi:hypothetical protein